MLKVDMRVDWGGRPLSELQKLMEKRSRQLRETPRDACIATAITVLKSLRPLVRKAKTAPRTGVHFTIVDTGWVGGWKSKGDAGKIKRYFKGTNKGLKLDSAKYMERCVRTAHYRGAEVPGIHPLWLVGSGAFEKGKIVHVYRVTPRHTDVMKWAKNRHKGCWYIAAYTQSVAEKAAKRMMADYLKKYSGLARFTLTQAMKGLSTKGVPRDNVSAVAQKVGLANINVKSFGGDSEWTVQIDDNLAYAAKAFKRSDAVDYAMAKAANSIAGMLRKRAGGILDPSLATPFPEIARHRRGA